MTITCSWEQWNPRQDETTTSSCTYASCSCSTQTLIAYIPLCQLSLAFETMSVGEIGEIPRNQSEHFHRDIEIWQRDMCVGLCVFFQPISLLYERPTNKLGWIIIRMSSSTHGEDDGQQEARERQLVPRTEFDRCNYSPPGCSWIIQGVVHPVIHTIFPPSPWLQRLTR